MIDDGGSEDEAIAALFHDAVEDQGGAPTLERIRRDYGDAVATAETAKEFKVIYQKQPGTTPGSYSMDHSAGSFIFDPQGRLRVYVSYGQPEQVFAHDIAELLRATM